MLATCFALDFVSASFARCVSVGSLTACRGGNGHRHSPSLFFTNYEADIVRRYGFALDGYPLDTFDLCTVSRPGLAVLVNAIKNGICTWKKIPEEQLATFSAPQSRPRSRSSRNKENAPLTR